MEGRRRQTREKVSAGGGGRGTHLFLLLVIERPLTANLFRDEAPLLLLIPPTLGSSLCFFRIWNIYYSLVLTSSGLAVCGRLYFPGYDSITGGGSDLLSRKSFSH